MSNFFGDISVQELFPVLIAGKNGVRYQRRYRGRYLDLVGLVSAARGLYKSNDVEVTPEGNGPWGIMRINTAETADGEDPNSEEVLQVTWALRSNQLEKPLTAFGDLTQLASEALQYAIDRYDDRRSEDPVPSVATIKSDNLNSTATGSSGQATIAQALFDLYVKGTEVIQVVQYVIERVSILPANYSTQWPTTNVNKQFTLAQLDTLEGFISTSVPFGVPATGAWLKIPAQVEQQQNGTWVATNQFWHADTWSATLYPAVT